MFPHALPWFKIQTLTNHETNNDTNVYSIIIRNEMCLRIGKLNVYLNSKHICSYKRKIKMCCPLKLWERNWHTYIKRQDLGKAEMHSQVYMFEIVRSLRMALSWNLRPFYKRRDIPQSSNLPTHSKVRSAHVPALHGHSWIRMSSRVHCDESKQRD